MIKKHTAGSLGYLLILLAFNTGASSEDQVYRVLASWSDETSVSLDEIRGSHLLEDYQYSNMQATPASAVDSYSPISSSKVASLSNFNNSTLFVYEFNDRHKALHALRALRADERVRYAEFDQSVSQMDMSSFTHWTGVGVVPMHLESIGVAPQTQMECSDVLIAVLDTGVDRSHPDLRRYTTGGPQFMEARSFTGEDGFAGHGTHVAGIIGAMPSASGSVGVCRETQLLDYRTMDSNGQGLLSWSAGAITHAVNQGARIINASWGSPGTSSALREAVEYANQQGVMIIAAAGNSRTNLDNNPVFPAGYSGRYDNVLAIANSDRFDSLHVSLNGLEGSSFGKETVDFSAPGVGVTSTWVNGEYVRATGTSMSAPLVTGVTAGLMNSRPELTPSETRAALINTLRHSSHLEGLVRHPGVLSAHEIQLGTINSSDLLRPAWFVYRVSSDHSRIRVSGHRMADIERVELYNPFTREIASRAISIDGDDALIPIPDSWSAVEATLYAEGQNLNPIVIDLSLGNDTTQELDANGFREVQWKNFRLRVSRTAGITNNGWAVSAFPREGVDIVELSGSDLTGDYEFSFEGPSELTISDITLSVLRGDRWEVLEKKDGVERVADNKVRWVINEPENWSSYYSAMQSILIRPQVLQQIKDDGGDNRCFIASSIYGQDSDEAKLLRGFRDNVLMQSPQGRFFVEKYYRYSPRLIELSEGSVIILAINKKLAAGALWIAKIWNGGAIYKG